MRRSKSLTTNVFRSELVSCVASTVAFASLLIVSPLSPSPCSGSRRSRHLQASHCYPGVDKGWLPYGHFEGDSCLFALQYRFRISGKCGHRSRRSRLRHQVLHRGGKLGHGWKQCVSFSGCGRDLCLIVAFSTNSALFSQFRHPLFFVVLRSSLRHPHLLHPGFDSVPGSRPRPQARAAQRDSPGANCSR